MEYIYPKKLKKGDKVMIVAPSRSLKILSKDTVNRAIERLEALGLHVVLGKNIAECDEFLTSSIESRLEDIHNAFRDDSISGIFSVIGGSSSNQLLDYLDYDLIRNNPKIFCGFSDITILQNAILAKTGIVTYYGPHFSSRGMQYGFDYSIEYFKKCCMDMSPFDIISSEEWSDDLWHLDQENRSFERNGGPIILQEGLCTGRIIGGNLECLCVVMGTPYIPEIQEDSILFIEQDTTGDMQRFIRRLEQILQAPHSKYIKGIVFGRFQKGCNISINQLNTIISRQKKVQGIPIVANVDFGHTTPICTLPIGGIGSLLASNNIVKISILKH